MADPRYDIAVIGASFAGSLTALGLDKLGYNVLLIEKGSHPRFAVGESSTPIADMILRAIANRYDLPWLHAFSRYGSWQENHPEVACGLKRGFSYYKHQAGRPFQTDENHSEELLVAASINDRQSDTNWYRSDMDAFLVQKVQEAGIDYVDRTAVTSLHRTAGRWELEAQQEGESKIFCSDWFIDATGSGALLRKMGVSTTSNFRTHSSAIFSHFRNVKPWQSWLQEQDIPTVDYPYNTDFSALHHLLGEGWLWMLRFNNGITSAGLVLGEQGQSRRSGDKQRVWKQTISRYPSIAELFKEASFASEPGGLISTQRLQRRAQKIVGEGWVALPHTAGFVDPLHSTGIAHSLSGVERLLYAFESGLPVQETFLEAYERAVFKELDFVDLLVDGCYKTRSNFHLFTIWCMFYFIAAIDYEQKRLRGTFDIERHLFLSANHADLPGLTRQFYRDIQQITSQHQITEDTIQRFRQEVRNAIAPYNTVGLLDPDIPNMYRHTAANLESKN